MKKLLNLTLVSAVLIGSTSLIYPRYSRAEDSASPEGELQTLRKRVSELEEKLSKLASAKQIVKTMDNIQEGALERFTKNWVNLEQCPTHIDLDALKSVAFQKVTARRGVKTEEKIGEVQSCVAGKKGGKIVAYKIGYVVSIYHRPWDAVGPEFSRYFLPAYFSPQGKLISITATGPTFDVYYSRRRWKFLDKHAAQ